MTAREMRSERGHDYFLYADTAATHEGELTYLQNMIAQAAKVEVDGIKFHVTDPDSYMTKDHPIYSRVKKWSYDYATWKKLISDANAHRLKVIGLANDEKSAEFLKKQNVYAIEVHATGLNDVFLLETLSGYEGFVLLGISGATLDEITMAVEKLHGSNNKVYIVYGFQNYPTSIEAIDFNKVMSLQKLFGLPLVYADHTDKDSEYRYLFPAIAYALGVRVLEKHLILDKNELRTDHESAMEPEDFIKLRQTLDTVGQAFRDKGLMPNEFEKLYRCQKKAIVARVSIPRGKVIRREDLAYKRTSKECSEEISITQLDIERIIGRTACRDILCDEPLDWGMVE